MSTISELKQQLTVINSKPWQDRQYAYEDFAYNCRDLALTLASQGRFEEALNIVHWSRWSEGLESENNTLWSDFYVGVAKVILVGKNLDEAFRSFNNQQSHFNSLENVVRLFQESDASKLRDFLKLGYFRDKFI